MNSLHMMKSYRNPNQNYNWLNGLCQKDYQQEVLERLWRKGNLPTLMLAK